MPWFCFESKKEISGELSFENSWGDERGRRPILFFENPLSNQAQTIIRESLTILCGPAGRSDAA